MSEKPIPSAEGVEKALLLIQQEAYGEKSWAVVVSLAGQALTTLRRAPLPAKSEDEAIIAAAHNLVEGWKLDIDNDTLDDLCDALEVACENWVALRAKPKEK